VRQRSYVGVIGPGDASPAQLQTAESVGRLLAEHGAILVCGGRGGVMEAACRGAASASGLTVGILPGADRSAANEWVNVAIPTGLGELRNGLIVRAADAIVAVGGAYGTLSEIALALKCGVPVIGAGTWEIEGVEEVRSAEGAVTRALELADGRREVGERT